MIPPTGLKLSRSSGPMIAVPGRVMFPRQYFKKLLVTWNWALTPPDFSARISPKCFEGEDIDPSLQTVGTGLNTLTPVDRTKPDPRSTSFLDGKKESLSINR